MSAVDIDAVRAAYPIAQVVADSGVTLRPNGTGYLGCCPFHDDRTPSLSVDGRPGRYHCFGCGASGDVIDYVARYYQLGFRDAVAHLTHRPGMPPTPTVTPGAAPAPTPAPAADAEITQEQACAVNALAWQHFTHPDRRTLATAYLAGTRCIDVTDLETDVGGPVVGGAGPGWTQLRDALRAQGVTDAEMLALDLVRATSQGRLVDTYRNRVLVPVRAMGSPEQIAGFIGRDISGDRRAPKYRNPTRTVVFDKASILYLPRTDLHRKDTDTPLIVVEGPLDALAIAAAAAARGSGLRLTPVSTAGTALTPTQAAHVGSLTGIAHGDIVIALDADPAGQHATLRWFTLLRDRWADDDLLGRVLTTHLPPGHDPASWLATIGTDGLCWFDPDYLGRSCGPTPPGAEIVALALAAHRAAGATGDPTPAVIDALRPLATTLPARHAEALLACAAHEMTRSGHNHNAGFIRALQRAQLLSGHPDPQTTPPAQRLQTRARPAPPPAPTLLS
ncbi:MAG TPA: CHC2 zinc finger domain-containing protein [Dermatophilaceae bacterium]|nr:CHC2 zinc finger domain-containing protein [Dermatophilaceae bacterium]